MQLNRYVLDKTHFPAEQIQEFLGKLFWTEFHSVEPWLFAQWMQNRFVVFYESYDIQFSLSAVS